MQLGNLSVFLGWFSVGFGQRHFVGVKGTGNHAIVYIEKAIETFYSDKSATFERFSSTHINLMAVSTKNGLLNVVALFDCSFHIACQYKLSRFSHPQVNTLAIVRLDALA